MADDDEDQVVVAKGFLKIFSLQAGTCITSTIGVVAMTTVVIYNLFTPNRYASVSLQIAQYLFIYSYSLANLVGFALVSFASFLAVPKTLIIGYWIVLVCFIYWIILCIIGFIPSSDAFTYVCIDNQCPEIHWLYDTRWRNYGYPCPTNQQTESPDYPAGEENLSALYAGCENYAPLPMITSILLGILWAAFVVYSLHIYNAFKKELLGDMEEEP